MNELKQRELPFPSPKEQARLARIKKLLAGRMGHKLKRASEMFDYDRATKAATSGRSRQ